MFCGIGKRGSGDKELETEFEVRMAELAAKLKRELESAATPELKTASVIKIRNDILDITLKKMIDTSEDRSTAELWESIQREHNGIVEDLLGVINKVCLRELQTSKATLKDEVQRHVQELKDKFAAEKRELQEHIDLLESENKKYLEAIIKRSKMLTVANTSVERLSPSIDSSYKESKRIVLFPIAHRARA